MMLTTDQIDRLESLKERCKLDQDQSTHLLIIEQLIDTLLQEEQKWPDKGHRVYLVYQDWDGGQSQYVVAKNRKEAGTKVSFPYSYISYKPSLTTDNGDVVNSFGTVFGKVIY